VYGLYSQKLKHSDHSFLTAIRNTNFIKKISSEINVGYQHFLLWQVYQHAVLKKFFSGCVINFSSKGLDVQQVSQMIFGQLISPNIITGMC